MDKKSCLGVVLSGGRSTRMGQNKALMELGGETLVTRVTRRLQGQLDSIVINAANPVPSFTETKLPWVADRPEIAGKGPLSGIFSAMDYAQSINHKATQYQAVVTAAVDPPFFPDDYVQRLIAEYADHAGRPVLAATAASWHPTFGLWPLSLKDALEYHLHTAQDKSIMTLARQHDARTVLFAPAHPCAVDPFFNINTPDDFALAQALMARIKEKQP